MAFYTYIVASKRNGTLYAGMTDNLGNPIWEHKEHLRAGFTARSRRTPKAMRSLHPPEAQ